MPKYTENCFIKEIYKIIIINLTQIFFKEIYGKFIERKKNSFFY